MYCISIYIGCSTTKSRTQWSNDVFHPIFHMFHSISTIARAPWRNALDAPDAPAPGFEACTEKPISWPPCAWAVWLISFGPPQGICWGAGENLLTHRCPWSHVRKCEENLELEENHRKPDIDPIDAERLHWAVQTSFGWTDQYRETIVLKKHWCWLVCWFSTCKYTFRWWWYVVCFSSKEILEFDDRSLNLIMGKLT